LKTAGTFAEASAVFLYLGWLNRRGKAVEFSRTDQDNDASSTSSLASPSKKYRDSQTTWIRL